MFWHKRMSTFWFCLPVFPDIHRRPKQIFQMLKCVFETIPFLSTFIHCLKHLDRAWDMFWIKSLGGTFKSLQKKQFIERKFELHAWVKQSHFGNFSERAGMAMLFVRPSKMHHCFGCRWISRKMEGKTIKCLFFYSKIF